MKPHVERWSRPEEPVTDGELLGMVRDRGHDRAWSDFFALYDPLIRDWCRLNGVGPGDVDDVTQRVWMRLVGRISDFSYDPSRKFRGWLRRLTERQAVDFQRERRRAMLRLAAAMATFEGDLAESAEPEEPPHPTLLRAMEIQEAVRSRVAPTSWAAFERCAIWDEPIADVARDLGMSYAAAYMAVVRVRRRLRQAGGVDVA